MNVRTAKSLEGRKVNLNLKGGAVIPNVIIKKVTKISKKRYLLEYQADKGRSIGVYVMSLVSITPLGTSFGGAAFCL